MEYALHWFHEYNTGYVNYEWIISRTAITFSSYNIIKILFERHRQIFPIHFHTPLGCDYNLLTHSLSTSVWEIQCIYVNVSQLCHFKISCMSRKLLVLMVWCMCQCAMVFPLSGTAAGYNCPVFREAICY